MSSSTTGTVYTITQHRRRCTRAPCQLLDAAHTCMYRIKHPSRSHLHAPADWCGRGGGARRARGGGRGGRGLSGRPGSTAGTHTHTHVSRLAPAGRTHTRVRAWAESRYSTSQASMLAQKHARMCTKRKGKFGRTTQGGGIGNGCSASNESGQKPGTDTGRQVRRYTLLLREETVRQIVSAAHLGVGAAAVACCCCRCVCCCCARACCKSDCPGC